MLINKTKKFIFFHNPKACGKVIRKYILENADQDEIVLFRGISKKDNIDLAHIDQSMLFDYIDFSVAGYYKFSVIRDPYDRLVSAYNWLTNYAAIMCKKYVLDRNINFLEDILDYLDANPDEVWNPLLPWFKPQYVYTHKDSKVNCDLLVDFHNLEEGMKIIRKKYGYKTNNIIDQNRLKRKTLLSEKQKRVTEKIYAKDFELLKFAKRSYLG